MAKITALLEPILEPTNGSKTLIETSIPFTVKCSIEGTADLLLHAWNCQYVEDKSNQKKGSKGRKTDDIEQFIYRNETGHVCIPGEYVRMSMVNAAKYKQDPRSPRKSAMDLIKAALIVNEKLCSLGEKKWDYVDQRRVVIQRSGINRSRPAFHIGWQIEFSVTSLMPEYCDKNFIYELLDQGGKFIGIGDFRPTFGRYQVIDYKLLL